MNQFVLHIHSISQEIKYKVLMQSRKPPKSSKNYHYRGFRVMFLASDFHLFFFNAPGHLLGYSATATVRALALCPSAWLVDLGGAESSGHPEDWSTSLMRFWLDFYPPWNFPVRTWKFFPLESWIFRTWKPPVLGGELLVSGFYIPWKLTNIPLKMDWKRWKTL